MMMKKMLMAALLACAFGPALADDMGFDDAPRTERRIVTRSGDAVRVELGKLAELRALNAMGSLGGLGGAPLVHMHHAKLIKNAPYSAEMVSERLQTLGDGNQIVNKTSAMSYRDSAGRTRTEVRNDEGEVRSVTIVDPVEGARYILRPRDKTAIRIAAPDTGAIAARAAAGEARIAAAEARAAGAEARLVARAAAAQARAKIDELRKEGKLAGSAEEHVHERVVVKQVERGGEQRDVQIRIVQGASPAIAARIAPMIAGAVDEHKWAAKAETKDLGTRDFHGVKATGTARSYAIPAGEIGNRNAIVVSTETWVSPELQAVVYQKRTDPRAGEAVFRLERLSRADPAAALFAVPSDYTVTDPVAAARSRLEKKSQ